MQRGKQCWHGQSEGLSTLGQGQGEGSKLAWEGPERMK